MVDGFECDDEELTEEIRESNPRYGELYDKYMEDELTEEEEEEYNDLRWETQGDVIWNLNSNLFEAWR
jgi:tRNA G37 N-methylase Trm5